MTTALPIDDSRWQGLTGAYRVVYDPRAPLRALAVDFTERTVWAELWEQLHHQGDVGEASYASIPSLVALGQRAPARDWNLYGLAAAIEVARHRRSNPRLPTWLSSMYVSAWAALRTLAVADLANSTDSLVIRSAFAVVALSRGNVRLGALLSTIDASEIDDELEERMCWTELYDDGRVLPRLA